MSMFGVPYSPMVPSLTRWQSGTNSRIANSRFSVPTTLFTWVNTACLRSIIEYGAARCSAKWTTASGPTWRRTEDRKSYSQTSPENTSMVRPVTAFQTRSRSVSERIGVSVSTPSS